MNVTELTISELPPTALRLSREGIEITNAMICYILNCHNLNAYEISHLKTARAALQIAQFELSHLK
jgi:hypothetical protein